MNGGLRLTALSRRQTTTAAEEPRDEPAPWSQPRCRPTACPPHHRLLISAGAWPAGGALRITPRHTRLSATVLTGSRAPGLTPPRLLLTPTSQASRPGQLNPGPSRLQRQDQNPVHRAAPTLRGGRGWWYPTFHDYGVSALGRVRTSLIKVGNVGTDSGHKCFYWCRLQVAAWPPTREPRASAILAVVVLVAVVVGHGHDRGSPSLTGPLGGLSTARLPQVPAAA